MRYFLDNFENVYNKSNPFGFFPDWDHYPKTGTHIGTDFRVVIGTSVFAPADGEMLKTEVSPSKGNVGIYVFEHKGTTWGLELCHLRELPQTGQYKEGIIIAHSGNTGGATTGAHLHAVLHRDAKVTKHYQELQSRDDFLRLEADGAVIDCFKWFCDVLQEVVTPPIEEVPTPVTVPETVSPPPAPKVETPIEVKTVPIDAFFKSLLDFLLSLFKKR